MNVLQVNRYKDFGKVYSQQQLMEGHLWMI